MSSIPTHALASDASVLLGHAYLQSVVEKVGARALFIKGPVLTLQRLRSHHLSSDVDVLVAPDDFARVCDELTRRGWKERPTTLLAQLTTIHSTTFVNENWPCDLDVHRHFPGMDEAPDSTFEALWETRTTEWFAHRPCEVTSRPASAIILALHSLRGTQRQPRHRGDLNDLLAASFSSLERSEIARLSRATGANEPLREVLNALGLSPLENQNVEGTEVSARWIDQVNSGTHATYIWLALLRDARGAARARLLIRAIWPSRRDVAIQEGAVWIPAMAVAAIRVRRILRGLKELPTALAALHQAPQSQTHVERQRTTWS